MIGTFCTQRQMIFIALGTRQLLGKTTTCDCHETNPQNNKLLWGALYIV